ncbi:hypothetical protein D3C87_1253620 [compost metagenome]
MAEHGVDLAIAHDQRRLDEFPLTQRKHGTAHHAGHGWRVGDAECEDDAVLVGAEDREKTERQENARKSEKRIVDGHDDAIHPAPGITADKADQRAADRREADRQETDPDTGARADHQTAENIAPELVCAEKMARTGCSQTRSETELHRIIRCPEQSGNGSDEQEGNEYAADKPVECELFHSATTRGSKRG